MVPDPVAPTEAANLPSRNDFLDDDDENAPLPSTEEAADEATPLEETTQWKSMRQLSHWREMSQDIEDNVLKDQGIKLKKAKEVKRGVKDKQAFRRGLKDSEKIELRAARIEQGMGRMLEKRRRR